MRPTTEKKSPAGAGSVSLARRCLRLSPPGSHRWDFGQGARPPMTVDGLRASKALSRRLRQLHPQVRTLRMAARPVELVLLWRVVGRGACRGRVVAGAGWPIPAYRGPPSLPRRSPHLHRGDSAGFRPRSGIANSGGRGPGVVGAEQVPSALGNIVVDGLE